MPRRVLRGSGFLPIITAGFCLLPASGEDTLFYIGPPTLARLWEDGTQWISPDGDPLRYPNNGDSAQISTGWLRFRTDPSIYDLTLTSPTTSFFLLDGRTLQVDGTFEFWSAEFREGSLFAEDVSYLTSLVFDDVNATIAQLDPGDGFLTLANGSVLRNTGQFILPSSGIFERGLNNRIENFGEFIKSKSGTVRIAMPFTQIAGTIEVQKGVLRFSGDTNIRGGGLSSAGGLEFQGLTTFLENLAIETSGDGYVSFEQLVTIGGSLSSSGTPDASGHVRMSTTFFTNSLLLSDDAPLVMLRGRQGSTQTMLNRGAVIWEGGQLGPITNEAAERGSFVIKNNPFGISNPGAPDPSIKGTFLNRGYLLQEGRALTLESDGNLISQGTYEMSGGSIEGNSPNSPGAFRSLGVLRKTALDGGETIATISVPLEASDIQVESGQLSLQGEAELSGTIVVDDAQGAGSKLLLESGTKKINFRDVLFEGEAGGTVEVRDAWVELEGTLTTAGSGGLFHLKNENARLTTSSGGAVTIQASELTPFLVGDAANRPTIEPSGALWNRGRMELDRARLSGTILVNAGALSLDQDLEFIATTGTGPELRNESPGVFSQGGMVDLGESGRLLIETGNHVMTPGSSVGHSVASTDTTYSLGPDAELAFEGRGVSPGELAADFISIEGSVDVISGELSIDAATRFESRSGDFQVQPEAKLALNDSLSGSGADFSVFGTLSSSEPLVIASGASLGGNGRVTGSVDQAGAIIPRGMGEGELDTLMIVGDLVQTSEAQTKIGISPTLQASLVLSGTAQLSGALVVEVFQLSEIPVEVPYVILTASSLTGEFDELIVESSDDSAAEQFSLEYTENQVLLTRTVGGVSYDSWIEESFGGITDPEITGSTKDPDDDEVENAFEYLQGTDPLVRGPQPDIILELVPDVDDPEEFYLRARLEIAPDRVGYELSLLDLRDLEDPEDDQLLPTEFEVIGNEAILTTLLPVTSGVGFFRLLLTVE